MAQVRVTVACKKGDGKAFKAVEGSPTGTWYNLREAAMSALQSINKGDVIVIEVEKVKNVNYVTSLTKATTEPTSAVESATGFTCPVCNKPMKDGKYPVCYMCNKKGLKAPTTTKEEKTETKKSYDNPERTAQIQRGNALNASAAIAANYQFVNSETGEPDYEMAAQYTKLLAQTLLDWLRAE
jgi:hypothetical protein